MSANWGNKIELSIFGESHGPAIGIVIGGLPAGMKLDVDEIRWFMKRRAPGQNQMSTPRKEKDEFQIVSGILDGVTTGAPLCAMIENNQLDLVIFLREAVNPLAHEPSSKKVCELCDMYNIPLATNLATAELLIKSLERGDMEWREIYQ